MPEHDLVGAQHRTAEILLQCLDGADGAKAIASDPCNDPWRVDETDIKLKGRWTYLYRAVDSRGQTIDLLLSAERDATAAKCFFRKALLRQGDRAQVQSCASPT